jgi:hypothetical protein
VNAVVDTILGEKLVRIIVKNFQQLFLAPVVLSQEDRCGTGRYIQDFCDVL